jgi:predicted SAM-dependent methyltransferase
MRLNLGCGHDKRDGWVNVDKYAAATPDQVVDLERFPWPWADDSVDGVLMRHVLEHLGRDTDVYLNIFKELWRVCRADARLEIVVPHPRHDSFLNDPTHVRAVTPEGLQMFDRAQNRTWQREGIANTTLGLYLDVDFTLEKVDMTPAEPWRTQLRKGKLKPAELADAMRRFNNVIAETTVILSIVKPLR